MLESAQPSAEPVADVGSLRPASAVLNIGNRMITRVRIAANIDEAHQLQSSLDPTTIVLSPATTPLFVSGFSNEAMQPLSQLFSKYNMQAIPGPGQIDVPVGPMEAGSAVAISLMEGDVNVSAVGTVTYVKGNTVLAFGHPFMSLGKTSLPMSIAYVHGIINSGQASFKMASPVKQVGTLIGDRKFAVSGQLGVAPVMLPVTMRLQDASRKFDRKYQLSMVHDEKFTPSLLYLYSLTSGASQIADFETAEGTFNARVTLDTREAGTITKNMVSSPLAPQSPMPMSDLYLLVDALMQNPYQKVTLTNADINISYQPARMIATIEKVVPQRPIARPGEKVLLDVYLRPYGKAIEKRTIEVTTPFNSMEPAMIVLVSGGVHGQRLQPLLSPMPFPEEGVKGIIRWYTSLPPANTIVTSQVVYSPQLIYHGQPIDNIPPPLLDVMQFANGTASPHTNISPMVSDNPQQASAEEEARAIIRPIITSTSLDVPYLVTGGEMVLIGIDDAENRTSMESASQLAMLFPTLSAGVMPLMDQSPEDPGDEEMYLTTNWQTARQREQFAALMHIMPNISYRSKLPFSLPRIKFDQKSVTNMPLSFALAHQINNRQNTPATPPKAPNVGNPEEPNENPADNNPTDEKNKPEPAGSKPLSSEGNPLLTQSKLQWSMSGWNDYLLGEHQGTTVTSKGSLVVMPKVDTLNHIDATGMIPWKMVTTKNGSYLAGWNSAQLLHIDANGKSDIIFPKDPVAAEMTLTALTCDPQGSLYLASWPDKIVRVISPTGTVIKSWQLASEIIWDLAVTTDGRLFAATDHGNIYQLSDDPKSSLTAKIKLPDQNAYCLATGKDNSLYCATSPRGKIYRISPTGELSAIYQGETAVSALAIADDGTIYIGTSPDCQVLRLSTDGKVTPIMQGVGTANFHVYAMAFSGSELYIATGPTGGIYRISSPSGSDPEITTIFARSDEKSAGGTITHGAESVIVTAINTLNNGDVMVAGTAPGQIFKISPRADASYISEVIAPGINSKWGNIELDYSVNGRAYSSLITDSPIQIDTRSGRTAWPDATWSNWKPISASGIISSPPATFMQLRINLHQDKSVQPALNLLRFTLTTDNQAPQINLQNLLTGDRIHGKYQVTWDGLDPDDDQIIYTAFVSSDQGANWTQLKIHDKSTEEEEINSEAGTAGDGDQTTDNGDEEPPVADDTPVGNATTDIPDTNETPLSDGNPQEGLSEYETSLNSFEWDTKLFADGMYQIKLIASDKYARPINSAASEIISGRFIIDNSPPVINLPKNATSWESVSQFIISDSLSPILGGKFRIDDGNWIAIQAVDGSFDSMTEKVNLLYPGAKDLTDGNYSISIIIADAAANLLVSNVPLQIGVGNIPDNPNNNDHNNDINNFIWW